MQRALKHLSPLVLLSLLCALSACGGGGGSPSATGGGTVTGVTTPSSVSVVTATHQAN
jgi:hypothetical protein